jgi:hypothetical protein
VLCIYCYDQNDTISANVNNLILNGGFENTTCTPGQWGDCFCPNAVSYNCDISNWTCTGGGSASYPSIFNNGLCYIPEGAYAAYFGNFDCATCSGGYGDFSCMTDTLCRVTGISSGYPANTGTGYGDSTGVSLEQTVTGLTTGNTYVLEFWAGGEYDLGLFTDPGLFAIDVGFGNIFLRDKSTASAFIGIPDTIGTRYIIEFKATSSSHTIKFTNWGHIFIHCTELVLDDVRLYTLAELDASVPHCPLGIDNPDFQNADYLISPNPVSNKLNIKTNSNQLSEIIFYDITSRKLLQQTFFNATTINTSQFSKGIYFYELRNKNEVVKKGKVVKD